MTFVLLRAIIECHHKAVTPATCGQAMLVPEATEAYRRP